MESAHSSSGDKKALLSQKSNSDSGDSTRNDQFVGPHIRHITVEKTTSCDPVDHLNPFVQQNLNTSPSNISLAGSIIDQSERLTLDDSTISANLSTSLLDPHSGQGQRHFTSASNVSLAGSIADRSVGEVGKTDTLNPYVQQSLSTSPSNVSLAGSIDLNLMESPENGGITELSSYSVDSFSNQMMDSRSPSLGSPITISVTSDLGGND